MRPRTATPLRQAATTSGIGTGSRCASSARPATTRASWANSREPPADSNPSTAARSDETAGTENHREPDQAGTEESAGPRPIAKYGARLAQELGRGRREHHEFVRGDLAEEVTRGFGDELVPSGLLNPGTVLFIVLELVLRTSAVGPAA